MSTVGWPSAVVLPITTQPVEPSMTMIPRVTWRPKAVRVWRVSVAIRGDVRDSVVGDPVTVAEKAHSIGVPIVAGHRRGPPSRATVAGHRRGPPSRATVALTVLWLTVIRCPLIQTPAVATCRTVLDSMIESSYGAQVIPPRWVSWTALWRMPGQRL
jgi:hypothetical protein